MLKILNLTPNIFLRMKERLRCVAGSSPHGQPMGKDCVSATWLSKGFYWLSTFQRMTRTFSSFVSFQASVKVAEKTHPRGKSGRVFKPDGQLVLIDFCAASFVEFSLRFAAFLPGGFLKMSTFILSPPFGIT